MPRSAERAILGLILLGYLLVAGLYAVRVPIWNAPDEPAHYNFIRTIALEHRLPVLKPGDYNQQQIARLTHDHFPPNESIAGLRYESHQPPLYYLIETPVFLATEHLSIHRQVVALRLVTVLIGALVVLAAYRLASLIFPKRAAYPLAAAAFVAFLPMHVFMDAAIDNDALVELLLCLVLIVLVEDLIEPRAPRNDILVGALAGLAALTKLDGDVSAVLIAAGFVGSALLASDRGQALRRVPMRLVRAGVVALVISGWWFVRNMVVYGVNDPFALRRHAQVVVGQPLTGALTRSRLHDMLLTAFHSFWGQFGWMGIPYTDQTYATLSALSLVVALGIVLYLLHLAWTARQIGRGRAKAEKALAPFPMVPEARALTIETAAMALLLLEVLLVIVGVVFYNLRYLQPQGRYFFPALPALALFSVTGIGGLIREKYVGLVLTIAAVVLYWFCVFSLFQVIGPAFMAS